MGKGRNKRKSRKKRKAEKRNKTGGAPTKKLDRNTKRPRRQMKNRGADGSGGYKPNIFRNQILQQRPAARPVVQPATQPVAQPAPQPTPRPAIPVSAPEQEFSVKLMDDEDISVALHRLLSDGIIEGVAYERIGRALEERLVYNTLPLRLGRMKNTRILLDYANKEVFAFPEFSEGEWNLCLTPASGERYYIVLKDDSHTPNIMVLYVGADIVGAANYEAFPEPTDAPYPDRIYDIDMVDRLFDSFEMVTRFVPSPRKYKGRERIERRIGQII